jgi:hypothetical protein
LRVLDGGDGGDVVAGRFRGHGVSPIGEGHVETIVQPQVRQGGTEQSNDDPCPASEERAAGR